MNPKINEWIRNFGELFYPRLCITCNRKLFSGETYLCLFCLHDLPRTGFHQDQENKVAQLFWGRVEIAGATSWLYFRKGSAYQQLIHHLKYRGLKELGTELGLLFGQDLKDTPYEACDVIIPVPLHPVKERQRGYNQSEWIAGGLSAALNTPLSTIMLIRPKHNPTQTRKNRFERWQNVDGIFEVPAGSDLLNRKILLIDDVVTTGATLEAAAQALIQAGAMEVRMATLAIAEI
jgi:ComF family protein